MTPLRRLGWVVTLGAIAVGAFAASGTLRSTGSLGAPVTFPDLATGPPAEFSWEQGHPNVVLPGESIWIIGAQEVMPLEAWVTDEPDQWRVVGYYAKAQGERTVTFEGPFPDRPQSDNRLVQRVGPNGFRFPIPDVAPPGWYRLDGAEAFRVADPEVVALEPELPAALCGFGSQATRRTKLLNLLATSAKASDPENFAGAWIDPESGAAIVATADGAERLEPIVVAEWERSGRNPGNRPRVVEVEHPLKELNQARRRLNRRAKAADGFATAYVDKPQNLVRLALDRNIELSFTGIEPTAICARWSYDPDLNRAVRHR